LGSLWSSLGDIFAKIIIFFYSFTHNYGVAIILMTILVRIVLYPLMQKQMVSMREMQKIQPLMKEIQDKYKNDKEALNRELMSLYKEYKINPMGGCLPLLIQMPILLLLFQVLREFNEKIYPVYDGNPGFLWLKDLSLPDQLIKLPGSGIFGLEYIGIMPVLIGVSTYYQQKMTTPVSSNPSKGENPAEQTQKIMTIMMPLLIAFMSFGLPSGLTLYWLTSTLLGIGQQYLINQRIPAVVEVKSRVYSKEEKPTPKKIEKPILAPGDPWILPGYEKAINDDPSKNIKKSKKHKKDQSR